MLTEQDLADARRVMAVFEEAARLRAEVERLRELLKPFAAEVSSDYAVSSGADGWDGAPKECPLHLFSRCWNGDTGATVADCLRAAEALKAAPTATRSDVVPEELTAERLADEVIAIADGPPTGCDPHRLIAGLFEQYAAKAVKAAAPTWTTDAPTGPGRYDNSGCGAQG